MTPPRRTRAPGLSRAIIVGERVFLRRPTPGDEGEYLQLLRASHDFHRRWSPAPPPGQDPFEPQRFRRLLKRDSRQQRLLICGLEDGRILGAINLSEIVRGIFLSAYVGYWIGAEFKRQGYMGEALGLVLDHAFDDLGLHRVEANIRPVNKPSIALVRSAGFRHEGLALRYLKIAGDWRDHERWAMLAEDWKGSKPAPARRKKA